MHAAFLVTDGTGRATDDRAKIQRLSGPDGRELERTSAPPSAPERCDILTAPFHSDLHLAASHLDQCRGES
jgi:hypothetical protein